jgi:hypothetical protein
MSQGFVESLGSLALPSECKFSQFVHPIEVHLVHIPSPRTRMVGFENHHIAAHQSSQTLLSVSNP